jgi:hypothetical protein
MREGDTVLNIGGCMKTALWIAALSIFGAAALAEPAPTPTPLLEPGMNTQTGLPQKLPRPTQPRMPRVPAGPTPFDPGNAPNSIRY